LVGWKCDENNIEASEMVRLARRIITLMDKLRKLCCSIVCCCYGTISQWFFHELPQFFVSGGSGWVMQGNFFGEWEVTWRDRMTPAQLWYRMVPCMLCWAKS
jgi:hypothetical protein